VAKYRTVVADPPWRYPGPGGHLRTSAAHRPGRTAKNLLGASSTARYGDMSLEELARLRIPTEDDAHLYLWTTNTFMVEAHDLARAWGFEPKTILTWVKTKLGLGTYFRNSTEHVVFAVRGSLPTNARDIRTSFGASSGAHSAKPDAFYDLVEQASPGPYLELFARRARSG
jgi:N6-adenosine-specific RNA methylase IME4